MTFRTRRKQEAEKKRAESLAAKAKKIDVVKINLDSEEVKATIKKKEERRKKEELVREQQRIESHKAREARLKKAAEKKHEDKLARIAQMKKDLEEAPARREEKKKKYLERKSKEADEKEKKKAAMIAEARIKHNIPDDVGLEYDEVTNRFKVIQKGTVKDGKLDLSKQDPSSLRIPKEYLNFTTSSTTISSTTSTII